MNIGKISSFSNGDEVFWLRYQRQILRSLSTSNSLDFCLGEDEWLKEAIFEIARSGNNLILQFEPSVPEYSFYKILFILMQHIMIFTIVFAQRWIEFLRDLRKLLRKN